MRITPLRGFLLAQGVIVAALSLAPDDSWVHVLGRVLAGWSAAAAVVVGTRRQRPPAAAAYYLFGLGVFLNVAGTLVEQIVATLDPDAMLPTVAEPFWLAIYPCFVAGMILLIRRRGGGQLSTLVDSSIITVGLGLLAWVFMIQPQAQHFEASVLARAVQTAYPLADLVVLAAMVRLLIGGGSRSPAFRLMIAALLGLLAGDLGWAISSALGIDPGPVTRRVLAGTYQVVFALMGAAALHPSVRELAAPSPRAARLGPGLLLGLGAASLVAPGLLLWETARGDVPDAAAIAVSSAVLFLLGVGRMAELVRRIEDRTRELARRNRSARMVLDTVNEGLLRVARDGTVLEERSAAVDRWFGPFPAGTPFADHIARFDPRFADSFRLGHEALLEGTLPEALCLDQLPRQLRAGERQLTVSYLPVGETAAQEGLLLVIVDVTDQRQLAHQEAEQRERLAIFQGFASDRVGLLALFDEVDRLLEQIAQGDRATQQRLLHTIKGNTSLAGLAVMAQLCHAAETELEEGPAGPSSVGAVRQRWQELRGTLRALVADRGPEVIELGKAELERLTQELARGLPAGRAVEQLRAWQSEPVERSLQRLGDHARVLARRLGKGEVELEIEANGLRLDAERGRALWAELVHVVNNAVDHGLEAPDERGARGKPDPARLRLSARLDAGNLVIEVEDDGRGIDWEAVRRAAVPLGLPTETPEQLTAALLSPGVSSRAEADLVSGRGLGLSVVDARLRALGGAVEVESRAGQGTCFRLSFPISAPEPAAGYAESRS
jgi:HPt (histidine-containing phosphotransfer) domain-containing protein